jgi:hypothetical protein
LTISLACVESKRWPSWRAGADGDNLPGKYKIKAVYNNDSDFLTSTSSVLTETIN